MRDVGRIRCSTRAAATRPTLWRWIRDAVRRRRAPDRARPTRRSSRPSTARPRGGARVRARLRPDRASPSALGSCRPSGASGCSRRSGTSWLLTRRLGYQRTFELFASRRAILDGARGRASSGSRNAVVPHDELLAAAHDWCERDRGAAAARARDDEAAAAQRGRHDLGAGDRDGGVRRAGCFTTPSTARRSRRCWLAGAPSRRWEVARSPCPTNQCVLMPRGPRTHRVPGRGRLIAVHVLDDSFVNPEDGTSAGDHLVAACCRWSRSGHRGRRLPAPRAGWRAPIAILLGMFGIVAGLEGWHYTREVGASGDDYTGLLACPPAWCSWCWRPSRCGARGGGRRPRAAVPAPRADRGRREWSS